RRTCALTVRRLHNKPNKVREPNHFLARSRFRALPGLNSLEFRALRPLREPRDLLYPALDLSSISSGSEIATGYATRQRESEHRKNRHLTLERSAVDGRQSFKRSTSQKLLPYKRLMLSRARNRTQVGQGLTAKNLFVVLGSTSAISG